MRTAFQYDRVTGAALAVYDPADRANTEIRTEYDAGGNVTATVYPDGRRVSHEFDAHGRAVSTTDIAGATTSYAYTEAGLLAEAAQVDRDGNPVARVAYAYDDFGRVARLERDNGVVTEYTYTSASQIATERTVRADASLQAARDYEYDPTGNLTRRTDTVSEPGTDTPATTSTDYAYDAHNRLIASVRAQQRVEYEHDVSGNVTLERVIEGAGTPSEQTTVREFRYGVGSELLQVDTVHADGTRTTAAQAYDAAGNLTLAADGTRYEYDPLDRPRRQTTAAGEQVEFAYWSDGRRASRATSDASGHLGTTTFYWDGDALVNEAYGAVDPESASASNADPAAGPIAGYLLGATRHARTIDGSVDTAGAGYFTHDRHGNVTAVADGSGDLTARYDYTDYGVATVTPAGGPAPVSDTAAAYQPFRYSGEYTDPDGTQHLRERTMRPTTMQFTSRDRAELHNPYWYGDSNPIMYVDPSGRTVSPDTVFNGVMTGLGVLMFAATVVMSAFTGGLSLSASGIVVGLGLGADAYGTLMGVGGLLAEHVPAFVEDKFEAYLTSDEAMWSDTVLMIGGFALGVAAAKLYRASARTRAADDAKAAHERMVARANQESMQEYAARLEQETLAKQQALDHARRVEREAIEAGRRILEKRERENLLKQLAVSHADAEASVETVRKAIVSEPYLGAENSAASNVYLSLRQVIEEHDIAAELTRQWVRSFFNSGPWMAPRLRLPSLRSAIARLQHYAHRATLRKLPVPGNTRALIEEADQLELKATRRFE